MLGLRVESVVGASCSEKVTEQREQPDIGFVWGRLRIRWAMGPGACIQFAPLISAGCIPNRLRVAVRKVWW